MRVIAATGLAIAMAVAIAAGVAVPGGGGSAGAATPKLSAADQLLFTYAKCMRGKGVAIPDPVKGKDGKYAFPTISKSITGAAGVRAKARSCAPNLSSSGPDAGDDNGGGFRGFGGTQTPAQRAAFAKFTACLKKNGVTLPSRPAGTRTGLPRPTGTGTTGRPPAATGTGTNAQRRRGGFGGFGGLSGGTAKQQAAFQKCRALLPTAPNNAG